jgi:hypothetical protein
MFLIVLVSVWLFQLLGVHLIKSVNDVTNYRLIISNMAVMSKVYERRIANVIEPFFKFHDNQFGFVSNGRCAKALFPFKSVASYFRSK